MKKSLLTAFAFSAALFANAQGIKAGSATDAGYAFDSFDSPTAYSDPDNVSFGIFLWNDTLNEKMDYIKSFLLKHDGKYASKAVRDGGVVGYTVSQPYGLFKPQVGVTFGTGNSINCSKPGNLKLRVGLKLDPTSLNATTGGAKIKFAIKDLNDAGIDAKGLPLGDSKAKAGTSNQWQDEIAVTVTKRGFFAANKDLEKTVSVITIDSTSGLANKIVYVTIDFEGGYQAVYPDADTANGKCVGQTKGNGTPAQAGASKPITSFDASKLSGFQLTFLDNKQAADCYLNLALLDFKFDVTEFSIGDIVSSVEDEKLFAAKGFVAYPSPAKGGAVKFSATAENVRVYDVVGNVVFSAASASEVNVDSFSKGLYIVKSSKGATRFVVE